MSNRGSETPVVELSDINPDPERFQKRVAPTFTDSTSETLGIIESWWEPKRSDDAYEERAQFISAVREHPTLSLPVDLAGYQPLRLIFGLPHPDDEMNDDWFEVLFSTLYALIEDFARSCFGDVSWDSGPTQRPSESPWAEPKPPFSTTFLFYASDIARKDNNDGGWDALLADPRQRTHVVQGVLMKLLDEHVLSALLFGGTANQQDLLAQWDRIMIKSEGYARKFKRCEEVQHFLGGSMLSLQFWTDVDRVTAQTAQMLLPLVNLQRQRILADINNLEIPIPPNLATFYQRLHDIVGLAGYASLCMARSTSIFQLEFPELGQLWEVDQEREGEESLYLSSVARNKAADRLATEKMPARVAKVKIVTWPRIVRFKPKWNRTRTLRGAMRIVLMKSRNVYYSGRANEEDEDAEDAEDSPDLHSYVASVRAARRRAGSIRMLRQMGLALLVLILVAGFVIRYVDGGDAFKNRLSELSKLLVTAAATAKAKSCKCLNEFIELVSAPVVVRLPSQAIVLLDSRWLRK